MSNPRGRSPQRKRRMPLEQARAPRRAAPSPDRALDQILVPIGARAKEQAVAALIAAVAVLAYVWIISAGHMVKWPTYGHYYDLLAEGFSHGRTSLMLQPPAALFRLADPMDPLQNRGLILHDASLYNGRYYLYWGPLPAIVLVVVHLLPIAKPIGDQYLVFAFTIGSLVFGLLTLLRIRQRLFENQPWGITSIAAAAVAFQAPILFILGRASVYEASIMGGQCCFLAGLYCAIRALEERVRLHWLALGALAWAGAMSSRVSLIPAILFLGGLAIWRAWRLTKEIRTRRFALLALAVPLLATLALLAAYNIGRFGSVFEFGMHYQLANMNGYRMPGYAIFRRPYYIFPNLYRYLFEMMEFGHHFPFMRAGMGSVPGLARDFNLPPQYLLEPMVGLTWCAPYIYLAIIPLFMLAQRKVRRAVSLATPGLPTQRGLESWLTLCVTAYLLLAAMPLMFIATNCMRYLADVAPALTLLASFGLFQLLRAAGPRPALRGSILLAAAILALAGAIIGILLAFTSATGHFYHFNPSLAERLAKTFSF